MMVDLMPWLIFARIAVNETDWKYGPEVIYDMRVDSASSPFGELGKTMAIVNMTMKLKCRSKSDDILSCYFHEPRIVIDTAKDFGKTHIFKDLADMKEENLDDDIFELIYRMDEIDKIVISSSIKEHKLDMIRALSYQLSLGGGIWALDGDKLFEREEQFTMGWCPTEYIVSSRNVNDDEFNGTINHYEIDTWPHGIIKKGVIKEIQRTRNMDRCKYHNKYFFGSREISKNSTITFDTKIKSSKSHTTLGRRIFTSYTENSIGVSSNDFDISTVLTERISLSLEKIVPASGPLPTINDPSDFYTFQTRRN